VREIVRQFAAEAFTVLPIADPVVEIGSRPAEGQEELADLRPLLPGHTYIGCDIQPGPGVDRVEDIHSLSFKDASVGTVLALDTVEHVADPIRGLQEVARVLRPGGVVLITSHMFMPIHAHPWDYWRFTPEGFGLLLAPFETRLVFANGWHLMPDTVFGVGVKGPFGGLSLGMFPKTEAQIKSWGAGRPVDLGPIRFGTRELWRFTVRESLAAARRRLERLK
jgi:SAM-dependent methyltransferase